jgi:hypothetical protein
MRDAVAIFVSLLLLASAGRAGESRDSAPPEAAGRPSSTITVNVIAAPWDDTPSTQVYSADDLPAANPGRPGVPVAVPGLPAETASGGVKAPQYFSAGVAGDHGEPIAQYFRVGKFLFPNNLPANAHGNGYADPNVLVPVTIGYVESDAGAFDVRYGNNAVDAAVTYGFRPRLEPFLQFTGDTRDYDVIAGWSPKDEQKEGWLALELAGGNGFLRLPERRQQYKLNAEHSYSFGRHQVTLFGAGYYGYSRLPGLAPTDVRLPEDTIDPHQSDRTHTSLFVASDTWRFSNVQQVQFSGFFRTYGLDLRSNFGGGLIRQSEFRTVGGGNAAYDRQITPKASFSAGIDLRRDAPRGAALARADGAGNFHPLTRNDFTISDVGPYISVNGSISKFFGYNLGVRRDEIFFDSVDRLRLASSYRARTGTTSPRATVTLHAPKAHLPVLAFSYGEAFHTNDPRIGTATGRSTPIATSRVYQLAATETIAGTDFRLALARVSSSAQLARIDPDTGLQQDLGSSLVQSLTVSARRRFARGWLQVSFARANAIDRSTGAPVPEAPRLIWDLAGSVNRLPWGLRVAGELEYVGRKPLGDMFTAVPLREIRGSVTRSFSGGHLDAGIHFLLASGYTGQTVERLQLPGDASPLKRIVGVRAASYVGVAMTYRLRRERP